MSDTPNKPEKTADEWFDDKSSPQSRALYGQFAIDFYGAESLPEPLTGAAKHLDPSAALPSDLMYALRRTAADYVLTILDGDQDQANACMDVAGKLISDIPFGALPPQLIVPVLASLICQVAGNVESLLKGDSGGPDDNKEGSPASTKQQVMKLIQDMVKDPEFMKEIEANGGKLGVLTVPDPLSGQVFAVKTEDDIPLHFSGERKSEIRAALAELNQSKGLSVKPFWGSLPPEGLDL